jgi:hypothetical protein
VAETAVDTVDAVEAAFAPFRAELDQLRPAGTAVLDAHTHLGLDEDGRSLDLPGLLEALDQLGKDTRAVVFPLHDPDRHPAYRTPNDRVLGWAQESGGRLVPFCRLNPAEDPVAEAERSLARGARGIKLHPRAQAFGFGDQAAQSIFAAARDAEVPILIHAGRGMPTMEPLAELALQFPEVPLILAHAAIADQGVLTSRLADHPAVLYDTSCFAAADVVELYARVPAERIVYGSDVPYGRPVTGLYLALRVAAYAGLDESDRALVAGGTMTALLDGHPLPDRRAPRVPEIRPASGTLTRLTGYLQIAFGALVSMQPFEPERALPGIELARATCRDPEPGVVGPTLERIDAALAAAESLINAGDEHAITGIGLMHAANTLAVTEPLTAD